LVADADVKYLANLLSTTSVSTEPVGTVAVEFDERVARSKEFPRSTMR
jgi:hypothetical protein